MAKSRFEYVKQFERENFLLPQTHIVIRVDGKGFHKFSEAYGFEKPNDARALAVMNRTAQTMMEQFPDIVMSYGDSDEYLFLLRKDCELFERREMKLISTFASFMSVNYVMHWNAEFSDNQIRKERLPTFDARAVVYPNSGIVRDYFSWRQVDCHINNLYNTAFWGLIQKCNMTRQDAENKLKGTLSKDKNEILFTKCGINYNNEPEMYKKGTVIVREYENWKHEERDMSSRQKQRNEKMRKNAAIVVSHVDIINDDFWIKRPWVLA
ncbi:tRNAHis guanylyltransferase [Metschnikowia bicuspidata var. bicuspidata NRRL YB-4993]|uniref:tRNA(His) guanylyltransferase n=1 Tax=Metschnikowia bicuspidata var. bicuspidata NRRL YB-4993 TaxID=869754 RepID=A0A1A0HHZ7_9ASCO|nr:tRNAHis guanylyltransferase [Metschnikowia bicuspidata var. bicuspidata NRRL YB-4993]OBA23626.1 tRNAHis guanylyltransferase [Metschnikowia bicuspidata var. bicuspidata NRRL YB-4993]